MANRHGLIAGATGTGKTVTLRVLAENFSRQGVPVFLADVKGDLAGLAQAGGGDARVAARVAELQLEDFTYEGYPVVFWDVFGEQGHPVRTTVSEMGPLLLARLFDLNETQSGVLSLVFRVADDQGLLLLDLKDLRAMLQYVSEHAGEFKVRYGNVSAASIGAIQRSLLALEEQGGERFFGEPALDLEDFLQTDGAGRGVINLLAADRLLQSPRLYATFLLWLLSELFERLPETGDPEKPKLVFFFDEAHLLFSDLPKVLQERIEQVVRLIRSKGVGVYFVTQNPLDLPQEVLGQLGNRVQHALRAFTPRDQKAVRAAAETFRPRPGLDTAAAITELGVGEALVSFLDAGGIPGDGRPRPHPAAAQPAAAADGRRTRPTAAMLPCSPAITNRRSIASRPTRSCRRKRRRHRRRPKKAVRPKAMAPAICCRRRPKAPPTPSAASSAGRSSAAFSAPSSAAAGSVPARERRQARRSQPSPPCRSFSPFSNWG